MVSSTIPQLFLLAVGLLSGLEQTAKSFWEPVSSVNKLCGGMQ